MNDSGNQLLPIESVVFDLGGVLLNWNPQQVLQQLYLEDPSFPQGNFVAGIIENWKQFDRGLLTLEQLVELSSAFYLRRHIEQFIELSIQHLVPLQEGLQLLQRVREKGYQTFILSNMSREFYQFLSPRYPFIHSFKGAVFSFEEGILKPDEQIYRVLFQRYSLPPQSCLFIDDLAENIKVAEHLGMQGIVYRTSNQVEQDLKRKGIF